MNNSCWESFHFLQENWVPPSRRLDLSSQKTDFKASRYSHLPAGRFNTICLREILNNWSKSAILLGKYSISCRRSEIYLAIARNFLVGRRRPTVVESIILRLEDAIQSAWEKVSTSGLRISFFVGKFQLPAGGFVLGLDQIPPSGQGI